jgi:hypothetical protein
MEIANLVASGLHFKDSKKPIAGGLKFYLRLCAKAVIDRAKNDVVF